MNRLFLLYDGRARGGLGTEDATVLTVSTTLREAVSDSRGCGSCAVYSYLSSGGDVLVDEQWECDCHEGQMEGYA